MVTLPWASTGDCFTGGECTKPDLGRLLAGLLAVVMGLTFFVRGLELGLFPVGESMAWAFARKGSVFWLIAFAFVLGFGTTVAEPASRGASKIVNMKRRLMVKSSRSRMVLALRAVR